MPPLLSFESQQWLNFCKSHSLLPLPSIPHSASTAATTQSPALSKSVDIRHTRTGKCVHYYLLLHPIILYIPGSLVSSLSTVVVVCVRVQLSMYDLLSRRFFGRTWKGQEQPYTTQAAHIQERGKIRVDTQRVYYKSAIHDDHCIGVVEYVLIVRRRKDREINFTEEQEYSIGWSVLNLFGRSLSSLCDTHDEVLLASSHPLTECNPHSQPIIDLHHAQRNINIKPKGNSADEERRLRSPLSVCVFSGTPRSLFLVDLGAGFEHSWMRQLRIQTSVGQQKYELFTCKALQAYDHLFRTEEIIGEIDNIGGMTKVTTETEIQQTESIGGYIPNDPHYVDHPHLALPRCSLILQHPTVLIPCDYETLLLHTLLHLSPQTSLDKHNHVTIKKRSLNVGVHNARCYVRHPVSLNLHCSVSPGPTVSSAEAVMLEFDGECSITDLLIDCSGNDPLLAMVFELEYQLEWTKHTPVEHPALTAQASTPSLSAPVASSSNVVAAYAYAVLNSADLTLGQRQSIVLHRGPARTVVDQPVYGYSSEAERLKGELLTLNITVHGVGINTQTTKTQTHTDTQTTRETQPTDQQATSLTLTNDLMFPDASANLLSDSSSMSHPSLTQAEEKEQLWYMKEQLQVTHQLVLQQQKQLQQLIQLQQEQQRQQSKQPEQQQCQSEPQPSRPSEQPSAFVLSASRNQSPASLFVSASASDSKDNLIDLAHLSPQTESNAEWLALLNRLIDNQTDNDIPLSFTFTQYAATESTDTSRPSLLRAVLLRLQWFTSAEWRSDCIPLKGVVKGDQPWTPPSYTMLVPSSMYRQLLHYMFTHTLTIRVDDADTMFEVGKSQLPLPLLLPLLTQQAEITRGMRIRMPVMTERTAVTQTVIAEESANVSACGVQCGLLSLVVKRLSVSASSSSCVFESGFSVHSNGVILSSPSLSCVAPHHLNQQVNRPAKRHAKRLMDRQATPIAPAEQLELTNTVNAVQRQITMERVITASPGVAAFVSVAFTNPYSHRASFAVEVEDPALNEKKSELRIVTDKQEEAALLQHHLSSHSSLLSQCQSGSANAQQPVCLQLDAHQTVHIPTVFQSFAASTATRTITISVSVSQSHETQREPVLAYMVLHIQPSQVIPDTSVHIHHWKGQDLTTDLDMKQTRQQHPVCAAAQQALLIHRGEADTGETQVITVRSTHPSMKLLFTDPVAHLSLPGSCCLQSDFSTYLLLYSDVFCHHLSAVTQLTVHCHSATQLTTIVGKHTTGRLTLPRVDKHLTVQCAIQTQTHTQHSLHIGFKDKERTYSTQNMTVSPGSSTEVEYQYQCQTAGSYTVMVHLLSVDASSSPSVLHSWLFAVVCSSPMTIHSSFTVSVGETGSRKSVDYENVSVIDRLFRIESSDQRIMTISEQETHTNIDTVKIPAKTVVRDKGTQRHSTRTAQRRLTARLSLLCSVCRCRFLCFFLILLLTMLPHQLFTCTLVMSMIIWRR